MRNKLIIILGIILLSITSCSDKEADVIKTTVVVSVTKDDIPLKDTTVYLFDSSSKETNIASSKANAVTSNNGQVTFTLEDIEGITVTDIAQTFRFAVFNPSGRTSVSVKKGETVTAEIRLHSGLTGVINTKI